MIAAPMRRLLLVLAVTASAAVPATASAASEQLTPAGYAALDKLWKLTTGPDLSKIDAGLNAGLCAKIPLGGGDPQARLIVDDCLAAMRMSKHLLASLNCPDDANRCTARAMRRAVAAGRQSAAFQARLAETVTGRCRAYFVRDRRQTLSLVDKTQRVVDAYATGRQARITAALRPWAKTLVTVGNPESRKRGEALMRGCDPA
jgi:hypothetical protein